MARSNTTVYGLYVVALTAALSLHVLAFRNGTAAYRNTFALPGATLPNTAIPIQQGWTGVQALDRYASFMVSIFWVDLDPRNVVAHIQGTHFLGTLSASWLLMLVEAHRVDASAAFLLKTYVIEVVGELVGLGFLTPLWCLVQLTNFPAVKPRRMARRDGWSLPLALVVGHALPTAMMVLGDPDEEGLWSQQTWVLLRLFHPAFTYAIWIVLRQLGGDANIGVSPRTWYVTAIVVAVLLHTLALAPILMVRLASGWINPAVVEALDLWAIFVPAPFWQAQPRQVVNFAQGVSFFLQWDELLTGTAVLIWALGQYTQYQRTKPGLMMFSYLGLLLALGGPVAAAAWLMLECEEKEDSRSGSETRVKGT